MSATGEASINAASGMGTSYELVFIIYSSTELYLNDAVLFFALFWTEFSTSILNFVVPQNLSKTWSLQSIIPLRLHSIIFFLEPADSLQGQNVRFRGGLPSCLRVRLASGRRSYGVK